MKNVAVLAEDGVFALFSHPHPGGFDSSRVPTAGNSLPRGTERGWLKLSIVVSAGINVLMK